MMMNLSRWPFLVLLLHYTAILPTTLAFSLTNNQLATPSEARTLVEKLIPTVNTLNDPDMGKALESLQATARKEDLVFDPEAVAGKWRVVHAPHLAFLSQFALAKLQPIEYYLTPDLKMATSVRYRSNLYGEGWLNTAGYYTTTATEDSPTGTVSIVWDEVWWNNKATERPTPPNEGFLAEFVQSLGTLGFFENLSFFPIRYVDNDLTIFEFFGFTITAARYDSSTDGLYVSSSK